MMRALRFPGILVTAAFLTIGSATALSAVTWDAEATDDHIAIRGRSEVPASQSNQGGLQSRSSSSIVRNCVPIGNGQLRCYTTDLSAPENGITAVSVSPAVAAAGPTAAEVAAAVATEFRRLPLVPGGISVQPSAGWTLVNVETIVLTDPATQTFSISILGIPVTVRATPVRYSWTFGDGSAPLSTTSPGAPWPDPTVTHTYRTSGIRTIGLTTEWAGEFQVAGSGTWQPIAGVATTTSSAPPLEVREFSNALVTGP